MRTHIDTNMISAGRSLNFWREAVCMNLVGVHCIANPQTGLKGRFTQLASKDGFAIARLRADAHKAIREASVLRKTKTNFYMLFLQKTGTMQVQRQNQSFAVNAGDMYFYDGMTEHNLTFDEKFDHLAIRVPRSVVEKRWGALAGLGSFHVPASQCVVDQVLMPMAGAALGAQDSRTLPAVVQSVFDLFSTRIFENLNLPLSHSSHARLILARVKRKIETCFDTIGLNAESVAQELCMSRRNLDRLMAGCGTSFTQMLMEKRLSYAADLLQSKAATSISVTQISLAVGIENHSYFSRKFRERFDVSPKDYRANVRSSAVHHRTAMRPS